MKFNDKIKNIKVSVENLIKDIQFDVKKKVALVVFVGSFLPVIGSCTQEELMHAGQIINNYTGSDVSVDIPDVVVEPPSVEPVVDDPVVEPEVVEPEEINPKDYAAVYNLDFEIPVYTEEEVEAAKTRFEENSIDLENEEIMNDYELSLEAFKKCATDYYITNQDLIYYIYNSCKDADFYSACQVNERYYIDESNGFIYQIMPHGVEVFGELDNRPFIIVVSSPSAGMEVPVGEMCPDGNMVQIGPGSWAIVNTDNKLKKGFENKANRVMENKDFPNIMLSDEEFDNCGFKRVELGSELSLTK